VIQPLKAYLETLEPHNRLREARAPLGAQRTIRICQEHTPRHRDGMANNKEFHTNPQLAVSSWDIACSASCSVCSAAPSAGGCRCNTATAAPTMPASFSICAAITSVSTVKSGKNFSAFLL